MVYAGSIERLDFGEIEDEKGYVLVSLEKGNTSFERRVLNGRRFYSSHVSFNTAEEAQRALAKALPHPEQLEGAVARLILEYPRELEALIDEPDLRQQAAAALEFHLNRRPRSEARLRLQTDQRVADLTPQRLLELYWQAAHTEGALPQELASLANDIFQTVAGGSPQEPARDSPPLIHFRFSFLPPDDGIDFSAFDLTCISGANGAGKSSCWMPSPGRCSATPAQAAQDDEALINNACDAARGMNLSMKARCIK